MIASSTETLGFIPDRQYQKSLHNKILQVIYILSDTNIGKITIKYQLPPVVIACHFLNTGRQRVGFHNHDKTSASNANNAPNELKSELISMNSRWMIGCVGSLSNTS